jgi:hypothetical protein
MLDAELRGKQCADLLLATQARRRSRFVTGEPITCVRHVEKFIPANVHAMARFDVASASQRIHESD